MNYFLIGADIVPTKSNEDLFFAGAGDKLVGEELYELLSKADYRIFNLETPLCDENSPIDKCGPCLSSKTESVNGLKALNVDLLTLANNHIMDQGIRGLESTESVLDRSGIASVGIGADIQDASSPYIFNFADKIIGIYACAEHEFSIATDDGPGANPFDPLFSLDHVNDLSQKCDYTIVLYHGGKEFYRYPSPNLQKTCRRLIDKGANLVICQHSHCIGCEEKYKTGTIIYGQGNFIFDRDSNEYWDSGLLVKIDHDFEISYIPFTKSNGTIQLAKDNSKEKLLHDFNQRSNEIKENGFIEAKYNEFAEQSFRMYVNTFGTHNSILFRIGNRIASGLPQKMVYSKYSKEICLRIVNFIECEAHRELCMQGFKNKTKGNK